MRACALLRDAASEQELGSKMNAANPDDKPEDESQLTSPASRKPAPELDVRIQHAIGRSLQAHYNDLLSAPIPDRFLALLAELEAKESRNGE
jgi:hypothetical protein